MPESSFSSALIENECGLLAEFLNCGAQSFLYRVESQLLKHDSLPTPKILPTLSDYWKRKNNNVPFAP